MQSKGLSSARLLEGNGLVLAGGLPKDCDGGASGHLGMGRQGHHIHHTSSLRGKWERLLFIVEVSLEGSQALARQQVGV